MHSRSHNYAQYLEATNVGLVHRGSHNYSQYLEATNGPHVQSRQIPLPDLSTLPLSYIHSGWAPVKLGIDLGGVFSKGPEQAILFLYWTRTGILFSHFRPYLPLMLSLRRQIPLPDLYPLE